jgi:hypothetical protein
MTAPRISPLEVWSHLQADPPALLVCAYDDEEKCSAMKIPGSLTLDALGDRIGILPKTREIVFY